MTVDAHKCAQRRLCIVSNTYFLYLAFIYFAVECLLAINVFH